MLAENISSPRDIPGFDNSAMDGYAVRAADLAKASEANPVKLAVVETVGAGQMPTRGVSAGQAVRTMTGAPIAEGADAIIPVERTRGIGDSVEFLVASGEGRVHPAARRGFAPRRTRDVRGQDAHAGRPWDAGVGESRDGRSHSAPARRDRCHRRRTRGRRSSARPARRSSTPAPTRWPAQFAKPAPRPSSSRWRATTRARFASAWPRR